MAEQFLEPSTTSILEQILEPQYNGSIGRAAAWADGYAHTDEGRFSYQWHWIDSHDYPPQRCDLNYTRDCADGGCVVSAIANQTEILRGCVEKVKTGMLNGGKNLTCSYALKWVSHFLGDIAQPLHASGRAAGGNFYRVKFRNVSTELHAVSTTSSGTSVCANLSRYGMATYRTPQRASPSPSQTKPSLPSSRASYHAFERTNSTPRHICGLHAAIHLRQLNAQQGGLARAMDGPVPTFIVG